MKHSISLHVFLLTTLYLVPPGSGQSGPPTPPGKNQELAELRRLATQVGKGGFEASEAFEIFEQALSRLTEQYGSKSTDPVRKKVIKALAKEKSRKLERIGTEARPDLDRVALGDLWDKLQTRRQKALQLIEDQKRYPADKTHGSATQPEVDRLVTEVREIWNPPVSEDQVDPQDRTNLLSLNQQLSTLETDSRDQQKLTQRDIERSIHEHLEIRQYARDRATRALHNHNRKVLLANARKRSKASEDERKLIRLTNEYRILMGKAALRLDDRLIRAAQVHSQYMQFSGQLAHRIPGHPQGSSPKQRARRYGFTKLVGENIAQGCTTAGGALRIWTHSAGHHRNLLASKFASIGTGQSEIYWTQVLGHGK